jgi:hypothetical protein
MIRLFKPIGMVVTLSALGAVGVSTTSRNVSAENRCHRVHGRIHSLFTSQDCTSPVGLCTAGKITEGGELDSATTFLALDAAPSAGMPSVEPAANLSYSGQLTIVARRGKLIAHDLGTLDATGLAFAEIERPASGTGVFVNPSNDFFISGAITDEGQGFTGDIFGTLCVDGDME